MSNLAIIPARGGSKGIPKKNIKLLYQKPLIVWSIEHALNSNLVDRVIVTTDCQDIADISIQFGAEVPFLRPSQLSTDDATTESALIHCLEWLNVNERYTPDRVILLQCTSPIRFKERIDEAINLFEKEKADSLLSVYRYGRFLWRNKKNPEALYDFNSRPRRQDLVDKDYLYAENGSIYISKTDQLIKKKNRLFGKIALFEMGELESFEIDTVDDWFIVENILKKSINHV
jgi:CMP-N,N'-diacetyllegionaminic acid synthase